MLILEIAAGIVLAVLILEYWEFFLTLAGIAIALGLLGLLVIYWIANPDDFKGVVMFAGFAFIVLDVCWLRYRSWKLAAHSRVRWLHWARRLRHTAPQ